MFTFTMLRTRPAWNPSLAEAAGELLRHARSFQLKSPTVHERAAACFRTRRGLFFLGGGGGGIGGVPFLLFYPSRMQRRRDLPRNLKL